MAYPTERAWLHTFADASVMKDLTNAARTCMREADECDPDVCPHDERHLMTPLEFVDWMALQLRMEQAPPDQPRREHDRREHIRDGSRRRWAMTEARASA